MDSIERARRKKLKLAEIYGTTEGKIVWMGGNMFIVCQFEPEHKETTVIYTKGRVLEV